MKLVFDCLFSVIIIIMDSTYIAQNQIYITSKSHCAHIEYKTLIHETAQSKHIVHRGPEGVSMSLIEMLAEKVSLQLRFEFTQGGYGLQLGRKRVPHSWRDMRKRPTTYSCPFRLPWRMKPP